MISDVEIKDITATSVQVNWKCEGVETNSKFTIEVKQENEVVDYPIQSINNDEKMCEIRDLKSKTSYLVKIKCEENSIESDYVPFRTKSMGFIIADDWNIVFEEPEIQDNLEKVYNHLNTNGNYFPNMEDIFGWTHYTRLNEIKVVIIGEGPSPRKGEAYGLAFSSKTTLDIDPSLKNIYNELERTYKETNDPKFKPPQGKNLEGWAEQGVLLLNSLLTIEHDFKKHEKIGWEEITNSIVKYISKKCENIVFLLLGKVAIQKYQIIVDEKDKHLIIKTTHPSSNSFNINIHAAKAFCNSGCFKMINVYLKDNGKVPIDWSRNPPEDLPNEFNKMNLANECK